MSEECPILVPCEGTHSDARLELKVPANDGKIRADGTVAPSQLEWVVEVGSITPAGVDDLMGVLFEPLQKCKTPVSLYGRSTTFKTWKRLPDVVIVGEEEDEPRRAHHGDAMDEGDGSSEDDDQSDGEDGETNEEWMDEDADEYDAIIFGVWLATDAMQTHGQIEILNNASLKKALAVITKALAPLRPKSIRPWTSPDEGAARALAVAELLPACDVHVSVLLEPASGRRFDTAVLFDSLLSLGMDYGATVGEVVRAFSEVAWDGDSSPAPAGGTYVAHSRRFLFRGAVVDADGCSQTDELFQAELVMDNDEYMPQLNCEHPAPQYPETASFLAMIKAHVKIGFFVPYTPSPQDVLRAVHAAALYIADTPIAAQRQGGAEVLDECGNKGPETVFREAGRVVNDVIMTLSRLGLSPGSTDAQMLY